MNMSESKSLNETLAEEIVSDLVKHGIVSNLHKQELMLGLSNGKASPEDWVLWINEAIRSDMEGQEDD